MVKDKEWLKQNVRINIQEATEFNPLADVISARILDGLIDQLEYPTQEKPVIPQLVASWIEDHRGSYKTLTHAFAQVSAMHNIKRKSRDRDKKAEYIQKWIMSHELAFTQAWHGNYQIAKEPRWIIYQQKPTNKLYLTEFNIYSEDGSNTKYFHDNDLAIQFTDESRANAVALLVNGEVKEIKV